MTYRVRNILIAVGLALVAALLTVFYVSNYKKSVRSDLETVPVLVAARDIPVGTLGSQVISGHMLRTQEIPQRDKVAGTITTPGQVASLIATQPIFVGEQVTTRRFGPVVQAGVRTQLKGTYRAIQINGNSNQLLSGVLHPGDHIDFVANIKYPSEDSPKHFARIILHDVTVLRTSGAPEGGASIVQPQGGANWVMLRVTDAQAQKLVFAHSNDDWWLALRPSLNDADSPNGIEDSVSLLRAGLVKDDPKSRISEGK